MFMFTYSSFKIVGDACVKGPGFIRHDVNIVLIHERFFASLRMTTNNVPGDTV